MSEKTRLARIRKEEYGGTCGICLKPVELLNSGDPWLLKCGCGTVEVPVWAQVDGYAKTCYGRRFEIVVLPKESEG
jgi:hypothetical protein